MNKSQRKVAIDLNIKSAHIKLNESQEIVIIWKRGNKSIDTRPKYLDQSLGVAVFNEKFQMKTALDYNVIKRQFIKKNTIIQVLTKDRSTVIGEADFDLSKYVNQESSSEDKLPLKRCEVDPEAFIEIFIKAKAVEKPNDLSSLNQKAPKIELMPVIEERESEVDLREEFEKKEQAYMKEIENTEQKIQYQNMIEKNLKDDLVHLQEQLKVQKSEQELFEEKDQLIIELQNELDRIQQETEQIEQKNNLMNELALKNEFQELSIENSQQSIQKSIDQYDKLIKFTKNELEYNKKCLESIYSINRFDYGEI